MRPVLALAALAALLIGCLAACSDDDPLRLSERESASFALRPQLNQFGAAEMLPINLIRLTVKSLPDSVRLMEPVEFGVSPEDPLWNRRLDVPLVGGQPVDVFVEVELINETNGIRTVEWSGIAGPFSLEPGETTQPPDVDLFRGSLDNLSITAVTIDFDAEPSFMEGDAFVLRASAQGATGTPQFFWSSLEETIALVDTAAGDSAVIRSLLPGIARLVVEAGPRADTLEVTFVTRIEFVDISPSLDTIEVGEQRTFTAVAFDAREDEVAATFEWSSSDVEVATVDGLGVVTAGVPGAAWIRASAAGVSDSARLIVTPVAGRMITWTGAVSSDWTAAANWAGGRVPGAIDTAYIPAGASNLPALGADAELLAFESEATASLTLGDAVLRVHGDVEALGGIASTLNGAVVMDGAGRLAGAFPTLFVEADALVTGDVQAASLYLDAGSIAPQGHTITVGDRLDVNGGTLSLQREDDVVEVGGDARFVQGQPAGTLVDGSVIVHGDLTVTADCGNFVATGASFTLAGDSAHVAMDCPGAAANRFAHLRTLEGVDHVVTFDTPVYASQFTAFGGTSILRLEGAASLTARVVTINDATIQSVQVNQETAANTDGLNLLRVAFTGFANRVDPQLTITRPGDAPVLIEATFDTTSAGPFIRATDSDGTAPVLELHVASSTPYGPQRTELAGGARAWWSGQPRSMTLLAGDDQVGTERQPLVDSLAVLVRDVFNGAVVGASVEWVVTSGGGSVGSAFSGSDAAGVARTTWTLGDAGTAQIVEARIAGLAAIEFTADADPAGARTVVWTGAVSNDWHVAGNWSTGTVPGPEDSVLVSANVPALSLAADATVARFEMDGNTGLVMEAVTLTVHGDLVTASPITSTVGGTVMVTGSAVPVLIAGTLPDLRLDADAQVHLGLTVVGDLIQTSGTLSPAGNAVAVTGQLQSSGTLSMTDPADAISVVGDVLLAGSQPAGTLADGVFSFQGNLAVVGDCGSFVATGTEFVLARNDVQRVAVDCPSLGAGNRFDWLRLSGNMNQEVFFDSNIAARRFTAFAGSANVVLHGAPTALTANVIEIGGINGVTIDGLQLRQETTSAADVLDLSGLIFSGFGSFNESQLVIVAPGTEEPVLISAAFDEAAPGTLLDVIDVDGNEPLLEVHVQSATAGGEFRTFTTGGGSAWWPGQSHSVVVASGDAQTGSAGVPLPDSLRAEVRDVFGTVVPGATLHWTVDAGGGSLSPATAITDAAGRGAAEWTLGAALTPQQATASVAGAVTSAGFSATSIADVPGATIVWTGLLDGSWDNPGNWSTGQLPSTLDTVFIPAGTPFSPTMATFVNLDGLIVEAGAQVDVGGTSLGIASYAQSAGVVTNGLVRLMANVELRGGTWPNTQVTGEAYVWERATIDGFLDVTNNTYLELTTAPLEVTGDVIVHGDDSFLFVYDSLYVGGSLTVGGAETAGQAYVQNHALIDVAGDFMLTGRGQLEFVDADDSVRIDGSATWDGVINNGGIQRRGVLEVGGNWSADGPSFNGSEDMLVRFVGSAGAQQITHLNAGFGGTQGKFGNVHVANPDGATFLTPTVIDGELTSDAGSPIVADSMILQGDVILGAALTAVAVSASDVSVSGPLTANSLTLRSLQFVDAFDVDSTTYVSPFEDIVGVINTSVTYGTLAVEADSSIFGGAATITGNLRATGHLRLAGRTTVGGSVYVDDVDGDLVLNGQTLELAGTFSTGALAAGGVLTMTQPTDSLIASATSFAGGSTAGRLTDGVISASSFTGFGLGFHASGNHRFVLRTAATTQTLFMSGPSLIDGAGARFATLRVEPSGITFLQLGSDIASLHVETDGAPRTAFVAPAGSHRTLLAAGVDLRTASFVNVPLYIEGVAGALAFDDVGFQDIDPGLIQLQVMHDGAGAPFVFTNMAFDPIADGSTDGSVYVRATAIDTPLELEIHATNITNGVPYTIEDPGATVTWPNDVPGAPAPATIAWLGDVSSDWTDGANWDTGLAPVATDIVWVFADRPNDPTLQFTDTVAGLRLEDGATLDLQNELVVTGTVRAGTTITGPGNLHVVAAITDTVSGVVAGLIAENVTLGDPSSALTVNGNLTVRGGGVTVLGDLLVTGSVFVDEGSFEVAAAGTVNGSFVGTGTPLSPATLMLAEAVSALSILGDLQLEADGQLVMLDGSALLDVGGSVILNNARSSDGLLTGGTIQVGGDWSSAGEDFRSTGVTVVFDGNTGPGFPQNVSMLATGYDPGEGHFADVQVLNPSGVNFNGFVIINGDLDAAGAPVSFDDQINVEGVLTAFDVLGDGARLATKGLQIGGGYEVLETIYMSEPGDPLITVASGLNYHHVMIVADSAQTDGPVATTGSFYLGGVEAEFDVLLRLGGALTVGESLEIYGWTTGSSLIPNGHTVTVATDLLMGDGVLTMTNPADLVSVGNEAHFFGDLPSEGSLTAGTFVVETGGNFRSEGAAFRSTGTALVMRGDTLLMSNPGPAADQGMLSSLVFDAATIWIDSLYVSGTVAEVGQPFIADMGGVDGWRAELRVDGDINTPSTNYSLSKIRVSGELRMDDDAMNVDTVQFTGNGQIVPVEDPDDFSSVPYNTILITGSHVLVGDGIDDYTNLTADVIVRGAGVLAEFNTSDDGTIGSLRMEGGDPSQIVRFANYWDVLDSVVVGSGVLSLDAVTLNINVLGTNPLGLRTTGTGVVQLDEVGDGLYVGGDMRFEGGSTDGLLTNGYIIHEDPDATFESFGNSFRSTGTPVEMHVGTIRMHDAGPDPSQGQFFDLYIASPVDIPLTIEDTLYVANVFDDILLAGSSIAGPNAVVRVAGDASLFGTQLELLHLGLAGQLMTGSGTTFDVDTTEFFGNNQVAPVVMEDGFSPVTYSNVVFSGGGAIDFGTPAHNLSLPNAVLHVRDASTRVLIHSADNGSIGSLLMQSGTIGTRVRLGGPIGVLDSVRVDGGILDLNGFELEVNTNGIVPGGITIANDAILEMNQIADALRVVHGPAIFTGGSTQDYLTFGVITLVGGDFISVNDGFRSTGTDVVMEGGRLSMTNAGPLAGQGQLFDLAVTTDGVLDVTDAAYAAGALVVDFASTLTGAGSLRVVGDADVDGAIVTIRHLAMGDSLIMSPSTDFTPVIAEFFGTSQYVQTYLDGELVYDTLLITGTDARIGELAESQFSLENAHLVVRGAGASATYRASGPATATSLTLENGATDFLVVSDLGIDHAVQVRSGSLRLQGTRLSANAAGSALIGFSTSGDGVIVMQNAADTLAVNRSAEFSGASTAGTLTAGTLIVAGDFYAENGAFQPSGTHQTVLSQPGGGIFPVIRMATPGVGSGLDRFRHLRFATNTVTNVASDLYVTGVLSGNASTPATALYGSTTEILTIHADGWQLNQGDSILVNDLTLSLDVDIDPLVDAPIGINGLTFGTFTQNQTALRVRHPGLPGGVDDPLGLRDVNFNTSTGIGIYVHAIDSDASAPILNVQMEQQTLSMPPDFDNPPGNRILEEDGAIITVHTT